MLRTRSASISRLVIAGAAAVCLCLDTASLQAQATGAIAGVVRDSAGAPIRDADIWAAETGARVRSDSAGRFRLGALNPGLRLIRARRLGYLPVDTSVRVVADSVATLSLVLASRPAILDTVVVSESCKAQGMLGFLCRKHAGRGIFLEVDSIDALDAGYRGIGDLFRERKGFRMEVSAGGVRYPVATGGWGCLVTLINGRPRGGPMPWYLSEVDAVEIYAEPSEVPREFWHWTWKGPTRCSLVIVWTRYKARRPPGVAPSVGGKPPGA